MADTGNSTLAELSELKSDHKNARRRTDQSRQLISHSINRYGMARSIVIDEDNRVLAGNGTVEGAKEQGVSKVRIIEAEGDEVIAVRRKGLSEDDKVGLALADNRTSELSAWDAEMLHGLAKEHDISDWFEEPDLDALGGSSDISGIESANGSKDSDPTAFSEFDHTCPRCGFEFDDNTDE